LRAYRKRDNIKSDLKIKNKKIKNKKLRSNKMKTNVNVLRRLGYALSAFALAVAVIAPVLDPLAANAAQLASRSITLSDSGASGGTITTGVGSGTAVTYRVGFMTSTTASSLVIDFCSNDPIVSDTCNAPTGMNAASASLSGSTGNITSPGWNVTASASQVKLALGSGTAASVGAQVFNLNGITNPSSTGSFYARIYTYATPGFGSYASATSPGNYLDYGGVALSTNQIITITARVQETLQFCVSGADPATWTTTYDCSDTAAATAPALTLGHGSPTAILDSSAVDTGTVYSQLSTNATNGAVIAMRNNNTTCGGLSADGGVTCRIPAVGATAAAIIAGTAAFGMYAAPSYIANVVSSNGTGSDTPLAPYATAGSYGMDNATAQGTNTSYPNQGNDETTFGSIVATTSAPCYRVDNSYKFGATASLTTPAGIYTANLDMVATGTF
jgi:hypothetical protein